MTPTVGVVGGGQLARMMIAPAVELGIGIRVLAEADGMSAGLAATAVGDYRDLDVVRAFARDVDVITFDHEHVPQHVLRALVAEGVAVHPGPDALLVAQDKLLMRERLEQLGVPVPVWARVADREALAEFLADNGGVAVVKTPRGGYDGKGVRVVRSADEAGDWFDALGTGDALLAEELVDYARELAQSVARRPSGDIAAWPVVESIQRDGVCAEVIAPAHGASARLREAAEEMARGIAEGSASRACSRSSCSRPSTGACSSTSWPCARTTPATGRWTARSPASSSSTCARCSTCRSDPPGRSRRGPS